MNNCKKEKNNKKLDFKKIKKNTLSSLNDVEYFLNNINAVTHYLRIYKIIKK